MLSQVARPSLHRHSRVVENASRLQPIASIASFSRSRRTGSFQISTYSTYRISTTRVRAVDGGVIDKPDVKDAVKNSNQTNSKKPPIYNVMLHNDNYNKREYVVKVLLKVVEGLGVDDAVNAMQQAHINGVALVVACGQDKAEQYVESLRLNGLVSTLEPGC